MPISRTDIAASTTLVASNPTLNTQLGDVFDLANANEAAAVTNAAGVATNTSDIAEMGDSTSVANLFKGHVAGLSLKLLDANPEEKIEIAATGLAVQAYADSAWDRVISGVDLTGTSCIDLANNWAAGGNLDTGTTATATWYSVWVIYNSTSEGVDGLFSTSTTVSGLTMPTGYDYARRVGWVLTDATNAYIQPFSHMAGTGKFLIFPLLATGEPGLVSITGLTGSTWTDVDYSAVVPSGVSGVVARIACEGVAATNRYVSVRPKGSASDPANSTVQVCRPSGTGSADGDSYDTNCFDISLDDSGVFEVYAVGPPTGEMSLAGWYDDF